MTAPSSTRRCPACPSCARRSPPVFSDDREAGRTLVRFAFGKPPEVIDERSGAWRPCRASSYSFVVMASMSGRASTEIAAPRERVWARVADVERAYEWQGGLDAVRVLERDREGRPTLVETHSDAGVRAIRSQLRFDYEPPARLSWRQERGDLRRLSGAWELEDLGDGRTRATHTLDCDPGRALGLLVRGAVEHKLRERLVHARPGELKAAVESP